MTWKADGSVYNGKWKDNYPEGSGNYSKKENKGKKEVSNYTGEVHNGKAHGQGKFVEYDDRGQVIYDYEG